jgi:hypothetical protein
VRLHHVFWHRRSGRVLERFGERERRTPVLARNEAALFGPEQVGAELLRSGLLPGEEGAAARALPSLSVTLDEVRIAGRGETELVDLGYDYSAGGLEAAPGVLDHDGLTRVLAEPGADAVPGIAVARTFRR